MCSQTCRADIVSNSQVLSKRARIRRGVVSTLCGPEEMRVAARASRLGRTSGDVPRDRNLLTQPFEEAFAIGINEFDPIFLVSCEHIFAS